MACIIACFQGHAKSDVALFPEGIVNLMLKIMMSLSFENGMCSCCDAAVFKPMNSLM